MIKKLAVISLLFLVAACDQAEVVKSQTISFNDYVNESMIYARDERTNLCFARLIHYAESLANVPCTPEVLELVRLGNIDE